jgi:hypothetical protein
VTLIVAQQEAVFLASLTAQKQQVPIPRLRIENDQLLHRFAISRNAEILAFAVLTDVERKVPSHPPTTLPASLRIAELYARSDFCECTF